VRDERWFSGEEITTLAASPLSCANDGHEDEEDEEEEKKKGDARAGLDGSQRSSAGDVDRVPRYIKAPFAATSPDLQRDQCWQAVAIDPTVALRYE